MTWFYVIAVVVVIGLIAYFVMCRKKGKSGGAGMPPVSSPPTE